MNLEQGLGIWNGLVAKEPEIVTQKGAKGKIKEINEDIKSKVNSQTSKITPDEIVNSLRLDTDFLKELIDKTFLPFEKESNRTVLISFLLKKILELSNKKNNCINKSDKLKTLSGKSLNNLLIDIFNGNNFNGFEYVMLGK